MRPRTEDPKEYTVSVNTNDIREAVRLTASALYAFVEEALGARPVDEEDDSAFEMFAHDILGVLTRHADELMEPERALEPREGGDLPYD